MAIVRARRGVYYFSFRDRDGRRVERRGSLDLQETMRMAELAEARTARIGSRRARRAGEENTMEEGS